jgi:hypothetical protein
MGATLHVGDGSTPVFPSGRCSQAQNKSRFDLAQNSLQCNRNTAESDGTHAIMPWDEGLRLDTDVLVAAFRSDTGASRQVLEATRAHRFDLLLSGPLMLKYESALTRPELPGQSF